MRVRSWFISILAMIVTAGIFLVILSGLCYWLKWQADTAMIGITITYILSGIVGGMVKRRISETVAISKKLLEGILLGTIFMILLVVLSITIAGNPFVITKQLLMIWLLIAGSSCLGRIL